MNRSILILSCFSLISHLVTAQERRCTVRDVEDYYSAELDQELETSQNARRLAEALYNGPLMRDGTRQELGKLEEQLGRRDLELGRVERGVEDVIHQGADEIALLVERLSRREGSDKAGRRILDSIHDAFGYRAGSGQEQEFDMCLILNGKAHLVVTKALAASVRPSRSTRAASRLVAVSEECPLDDVERYYGEKYKEDYDTRREAGRIAERLYSGPLMRQADPDGRDNLSDLLQSEDIDLRAVENIVRNHLYGGSDEFQTLLGDLTDRHGRVEASHRVRDSLYEAFGYRPNSPQLENVDACLILNRKAHFVVTKVLAHYMERKNLN